MDELLTTSTIMAALSTLTQPELTAITNSLSADGLCRRRRISAILTSPALFSLTLQRLRLLSIPAKTTLLAKHLISSLHILTSSSATAKLRPRDLDAVVLLLLLCDTHHRSPESLLGVPPLRWRDVLSRIYADDMLTTCTSGIGTPPVVPCVEEVARCMRFVAATTASSAAVVSKVAAAVSAVVALPSVEVGGGGGGECAICKEEMREGRDVCRLPCRHLFHWKCALSWLRNNNTCPCCRFQLPTDDVFGEIQRLWGVLVRMAGLGCKDLFSPIGRLSHFHVGYFLS